MPRPQGIKPKQEAQDMRMKNYGGAAVTAKGLGLEAVGPGEECEVEDGYCVPLRAPNGGRQPSIVERLAPGIEPADDEAREKWKSAGVDWVPPVRKTSARNLRARGVAPGVAAIMEAKAAEAEAPKAPEAEASGSKPEPSPPPRERKRGKLRKDG